MRQGPSRGAQPAPPERARMLTCTQGSVSSQQAAAVLGEEGIRESDLLPGKYEGGPRHTGWGGPGLSRCSPLARAPALAAG